MSKTYQLELTTEQMKIIAEATDMYMRVLCGQLGVVAEPFMFLRSKWVENSKVAEAQDALRDHVKPLLFSGLPGNASLSIRSPDTPESAKLSYDIHQVLQHRLAWDRSQEEKSTNKGVWHYPPWKSAQQSLPRVLNTTCPCNENSCERSETEKCSN